MATEIDRIVFDSGSVRVGAFRCHPSHPSFHNTGPASNYCFVFPRTTVEIQHEHERAFVANPNVVTFYNKGQPYLRNAISTEGDRCDWFGVELEIAQDMVRAFDPSFEARPETPFRFTRGWPDAPTYLGQRMIFDQVVSGGPVEPLTVEEAVVGLLENVVRSAYAQPEVTAASAEKRDARQRDIIHQVEFVLSTRLDERLTLREVADEVGMSVYHLCRMFRRATGSTLHGYRQNLRLRWSLESVAESDKSLVDIALDTGFSSHSHFTSTFRREFAHTPSTVRGWKGSGRSEQHSDSRIGTAQIER
jgi:AraC-like DNA-binding protein